MKLLLIGKSKKLHSLKRLSGEAKPFFEEIDTCAWKDLTLFWNDSDFRIEANKKNITSYSHIITRIADCYFLQRYLLVQKATKLGIRCLNDKIITKLTFYNKMIQFYFLHQAGLPLVSSFQSLSASNLKPPFKFPLILKGTEGKQAKQVWKCQTQGQLASLIRKKSYADYVIQPFVTTGADLRMIVIGNEVIGAYKRIAGRNFRTTQRGKHLFHQPTPREKTLAIKASQALDGEVTGVDIIYQNGKPKILEVNLDAGFKVFEKVTKINVAKKIISQVLKHD